MIRQNDYAITIAQNIFRYLIKADQSNLNGSVIPTVYIYQTVRPQVLFSFGTIHIICQQRGGWVGSEKWLVLLIFSTIYTDVGCWVQKSPKTLTQYMNGSFGHLIPFWLIWAKTECTVHLSLPKRPINQFKPIQKSKQQGLGAYCPNIYCGNTCCTIKATWYPCLEALHS